MLLYPSEMRIHSRTSHCQVFFFPVKLAKIAVSSLHPITARAVYILILLPALYFSFQTLRDCYLAPVILPNCGQDQIVQRSHQRAQAEQTFAGTVVCSNAAWSPWSPAVCLGSGEYKYGFSIPLATYCRKLPFH